MRLASLVIALFAVALYAVSLAGDYVYDDRAIVRDDPRMSEPGRVAELFWSEWIPGSPGPLWRPLTMLSFAGQWRLHGDAPWAFHLVNVLLYAGMCALVTVFIHRMTGSITATWIGGLLFAAHPVHVEAVAYLVGRAEVLSALGVLGGLVLMLSDRLTVTRALGIVGCFVLAVGAKEHGVLLAPMLGVIWLWRRGELKQDNTSVAVVFAGVSAVLMLYMSMRESVASLFWDKFFLEWTINPVARAQGLDRLLVPVEILGRYVGLLLFPLHPSPDYGANVIGYRPNLAGVHLYLGFMALLAYIAGVIRSWRSGQMVVFVLLVLLGISYSLISNTFFLIGISMGERLAFLTSVFAIALLGWGIAQLPRPFAVGVTVLLVIAGSLRTVSYAWLWNDELRLLSRTRQWHPESIQLHYLEAFLRFDRGELEQAEAILADARRLGPESKHVFALSARVAEARGDAASAEAFGSRAMDLTVDPPHMQR